MRRLKLGALVSFFVLVLGCGGAGYAPSLSSEPRAAAPEVDPSSRPGLATQWGESRASNVRTVHFQRADRSQPTAVAAVHYNDASGAAAQVALHGGAAHAQLGSGAQSVRVYVIDEQGRMLPTYEAGGRTFVVGVPGQRYAIRIDNHTGVSFEAVVSVDGLDVIDGREAAFTKPGYILHAGRSTTIEGFRTSSASVAAFRFGAVASSYAALSTGSARNVGVIGIALFAEAGATVDLFGEAIRREQADPFPGRYAAPPPGSY
ncbi:MAG: hypothetical protein IT378_03330 [Sandaracinaceae bacterium]|nr:hypothetical protein [Sandaracinaceae bacterium]